MRKIMFAFALLSLTAVMASQMLMGVSKPLAIYSTLLFGLMMTYAVYWLVRDWWMS